MVAFQLPNSALGDLVDLFVIDPITWKPIGAPIYKYESLIWTERYFSDSEFELKTVAVDEMIRKIPVETLVGIRQSEEIMIVEENLIETDDLGVSKLTVKGRSLTSYTHHRVVGEIRSVKYALKKEYTNLDAGLLVLYNSLINNTTFDYTKNESVYFKKVADAISNAAISDSSTSTNTEVATRWITTGPIDKIVKDWFSSEPFGFRIIRPNSSLKHISIDANGNVVRTLSNDSQKMCFDVYSGIDRSRTQSKVRPVIIDVEHNDLNRPNYLRSISTLKTTAHIATDTKTLFAYNPQESDPPSEDATGLKHRVLYLDGGEPEEGASATEFEADVIKSAKETLLDYRKYSLVDGAVSPDSSVRFGTDYFLGDIVSVRGRYGVITNYRVIEFIRSVEGTIEESYPTLAYVK